MIQDGGEAEAISWVFAQQPVDEVLRLPGQEGRHLIICQHHFVERVPHRVRVEGRLPYEQGVEHAAQRPHVRLQPMRAAGGDLRGDVVGSPAHGVVLLVRHLQLGRQPKVSNLHVHVAGQ